MRILCNLPLECFDDRAAMRGVELCTFGPPDRMMVDGVHYGFDVAFDNGAYIGTWGAAVDFDCAIDTCGGLNGGI